MKKHLSEKEKKELDQIQYEYMKMYDGIRGVILHFKEAVYKFSEGGDQKECFYSWMTDIYSEIAVIIQNSRKEDA